MAEAKTADISKLEGVRRALQKLGKDAKPGKIQEFVKEHFRLDMTLGHVSNYKSYILKKKKKRKAAVATGSSRETAAASAPTRGPAVSLRDIAAVKDLVGRVGKENVKSLIGMLGG